MPQTVDLIERLRGTRLLVPVMLGVMCGLRRGEIVALRWRNVDLTGRNLAIVESAEQTKEGIRYKPPKSGRRRSVALATPVAEELRLHRLKRAEELLRLYIRQEDDAFVYAQEDGSRSSPAASSICG